MSTSPTSSPQPGTIVVGVDDTRASDRALLWAADQARRTGRDLTLLHAIGSTPPDDAPSPSLRSEGRQVTRRAHRVLLDEGFDRPVHEQVVVASPAAALAEASADAELVVVGARGPGQLGTFVLGSVSRSLVGRTHAPLVVVPAVRSDQPTQGVLVAVDDRERGREALDFAYAQAALHQLPITVLGCVLTSSGVYAGPRALGADEPEAVEQRRRLSETTAGMAEQYPDVVTTIEVDTGPVDEAIVRAAADKTLVVLGSHVHSRLSRLLSRDVDRWVVTRAPCPVAVVPERDPGVAAG